MSRSKVAPTNNRRPFGIEELFFSTTDHAGVIKSGNEVFRRVAAFDTLEEMIGKPHNIIRHPDMPRAVFKLLWDYLDQGKTICAYVKNMAKDGAYYWVFAVVMPIQGGYLSIRFNPSSPVFKIVEDLYKVMLNIEYETGDAPKLRELGMRKSGECLMNALQSLGFKDDDGFMRMALATEMGSRAKGMTDAGIVRKIPQAEGEVGVLLSECVGIDKVLDRMFLEVEGFLGLITQLETNSKFLSTLARDISLHSLNSLVACSKLGDRGRGLAVVAENLAFIAKQSMEIINQITETIGELVSALRESTFYISAAKLQVEISIVFLDEVASQQRVEGQTTKDHQDDLHQLSAAFANTVSATSTTLPRIVKPLQDLSLHFLELDRTMLALSAVPVVGQVETARLTGAEIFRQVFDEIAVQVEIAKAKLHDFAGEIDLLNDGMPHLQGQRDMLEAALASFHLAAT
jgi:aerotaxis receptor